MQCPRCQQDNPPQARFYMKCGASVTLSCGKCGTELPVGAAFCFSCGQPVGTIPAGELRFSAPLWLLAEIASHPDRLDLKRGREVLSRGLGGRGGARTAARHRPLSPRPRQALPAHGHPHEAQQHVATAAAMYREMDMRFWLEEAEREMSV